VVVLRSIALAQGPASPPRRLNGCNRGLRIRVVEALTVSRLHDIGREINARLAKLDHLGGKAVDMFDSINCLLKEAEGLCDADGFAEFKQTYCRKLGQSRTYELLAVQQGRKTVEQIREATRLRVAKHRAAKKAVTEKPSVTPIHAQSDSAANLVAKIKEAVRVGDAFKTARDELIAKGAEAERVVEMIERADPDNLPEELCLLGEQQLGSMTVAIAVFKKAKAELDDWHARVVSERVAA
jgi:hypothetical protein